MRQFTNNQRVIVDQPECLDELRGRTGTVVRLRRCDGAAWVDMDDDIPDGARSFPHDDDRRNHVLLYPQECMPT